jgi:hypothetical protein
LNRYDIGVSRSSPEVPKLPYNTVSLNLDYIGILKREQLKEKKLGTTTDVKAFKYKKDPKLLTKEEYEQLGYIEALYRISKEQEKEEKKKIA